MRALVDSDEFRFRYSGAELILRSDDTPMSSWSNNTPAKSRAIDNITVAVWLVKCHQLQGLILARFSRPFEQDPVEFKIK